MSSSAFVPWWAFIKATGWARPGKFNKPERKVWRLQPLILSSRCLPVENDFMRSAPRSKGARRDSAFTVENLYAKPMAFWRQWRWINGNFGQRWVKYCISHKRQVPYLVVFSMLDTCFDTRHMMFHLTFRTLHLSPKILLALHKELIGSSDLAIQS